MGEVKQSETGVTQFLQTEKRKRMRQKKTFTEIMAKKNHNFGEKHK